MRNNLWAWGVSLSACLSFSETPRAADTDPPGTTRQLTYRSAFADYKAYTDAQLGDWRALNDAVAGAGSSGHAGHAMGGMAGMKGMEMPPPPAAPASASMPMKTMPKHDGHPGEGGKP